MPKPANEQTMRISTPLVKVAHKSQALTAPDEEKALISDDTILSYYEEAMGCIKEDRTEADKRYLEFAEMVLNEGDPSSASKEALVNLLKLKSEGVNQMIKILDLWTRMKLKERTTSSQFHSYQQNNKYELNTGANPDIGRLIKMAAQKMESNNDK